MNIEKAKQAWQSDEVNFLDTLLEVVKKVPKIDNYLLSEMEYLQKNIPIGSSVIDFGCGKGRHLKILESKLTEGLGIDINRSYLEEAQENISSNKIKFEEKDIENYESSKKFDIAISMYNTLGNVQNQYAVIESMLNAIKSNGKIIISIFSPESIPFRLDMYEIMGFNNLDIQKDKIITEDGFISKHFTENELIELMPNAEIEQLDGIGWIVVLEKKR